MADLTTYQVTDDVTDNLATLHNRLLGSALRAEFVNATTMSGTVALADIDLPLQRMDCNGSSRIVTLPAYAVANHPFFIMNISSGLTLTLTVQSSAGSTIAVLRPGDSMLFLPNGANGYIASRPGWWGLRDGEMRNGKLSPSVASNNLTLALKTLAGNDPSALDPVWIGIGGVVMQITAALSVTKNAATNWFNCGSNELKTQEVDYFAYIGYNATDGIVIGFARIPWGKLYSDFDTTSTNEKYCAISTITNAAAGDNYVNIGRFAATLSAGAGYTWSVPTYTAANLVQRPIFETRLLTYAATWTVLTVGNGTGIYRYRLIGKRLTILYQFTLGSTSSMGAGVPTMTLPFTIVSANTSKSAQVLFLENGVGVEVGSVEAVNATNYLQIFALWTGSNYNTRSALSATVPFTWAATHAIYSDIDFDINA